MFTYSRWVGLGLICVSFIQSTSSATARNGVARPSARTFKQSNPPTPAQQNIANEPLRTVTDRTMGIRNIRLDLRVDLQRKTVISQAEIKFQCIRPARTLELDAVGFEVKKVLLSQDRSAAVPVRYTHDNKKLNVELGNRWPAGQTGTVSIEYVVKDPKDGLHFFAPGKNSPETPLQVWSQGQTISNRSWFPCIDEPDVRQTSQVVVTVPAGFEAVSNGKLASKTENIAEKTVTFDWVQDKPHPSYLITLVVGEFDVVEDKWNGIPIFYYMPKGRKAEALPTYGKTPEMMTFFSKRFGIPYPWDKYAQISAYQFGGALENTSATTIWDEFLRDERSLLDGNVDSIVSHELAHQWWGDLVTCRDWSHTWLNEGFASYAEALWDEHNLGYDEYSLTMFQKASSAIPAGKTRPIMDRRYLNPDSMFDGRSYPKGAWVMHMLRSRLGDTAFFNGLKLYGIEHRLQSVETSDLRRTLERSSGRNLERFFYDWLERPGNPELEVTTEYLPERKQVRITAKQTQGGEAFHFPVKVALYSADIKDPIITDEEMAAKELVMIVPIPGTLHRAEVDPDQAVLATLKETKSSELWRAQLLQGASVPSRMRAVQHFREAKAAANQELLISAFLQEKFHAVKIALANELGDKRGPACRDALLQGLQSTDARVRRACTTNLGKYKDDEKVVIALRGILEKGDPSYGVEGAAIVAYANFGQRDALALITPWLSKPSNQHVLASSALTAIGTLQDPATLETLITWSEPGHPSENRRAAHRALIQLVKSKKLSEAQNQRVVNIFKAVLESDNRVMQFYLLDALPDLGSLAVPAIPAIERIADNIRTGNLHEMAINTINKIRDAAKAPAGNESLELREARKEVTRLQRELDDLRKRMEKQEKDKNLKP